VRWHARWVRAIGSAGLLLFAGAFACTPLGLWIYEDPALAFGAARLRSGAPASAQLDLIIRNANDYDLTLLSSDVMLDVGGRPVGRVVLQHDVTLGRNDASSVTIVLPYADPDPALDRAAEGEGQIAYRVSATVRVRTPIGARRVVSGQEGRAVVAPPDSSGTVVIRLDRGASRLVTHHGKD
jgi:hypothetical protein